MRLCFYPTSSKPGAFYESNKVQKLEAGGICSANQWNSFYMAGLHNERVKGTSIETQFFNIGTTRYHTSKYLANLLTPSGKSDWRLSKNEVSKMERKPRNGQMILFDVKCLFTKVPLDTTIAVILRNICDKGKIERYIPRKVIKELLHLCAKHVHCTLRKIQ